MQRVACAALDARGDAMAVWERSTGFGSDTVQQAAFRPAGGVRQAPVDISAAGKTADEVRVAVDAHRGGGNVKQRGGPGASNCIRLRGWAALIAALWLLSGASSAVARTWVRQLTPNPPGGNQALQGVSCASGGECIAVGYSEIDTGGGSDNIPVAERYTAGRWTLESVPEPPGVSPQTGRGAELNSVACPAPTHCITVGEYDQRASNRPLIERYDGTAWTMMTAPVPRSFTSLHLSGVSCWTSRACVAAGYWTTGRLAVAHPLIERYNGSAWRLESAPRARAGRRLLSTGLNAVSCASARACLAVGTHDDPQRLFELNFAERWDGSRWTAQAAPNVNHQSDQLLSDVSCSAASDCTAVGSYSAGSHGAGFYSLQVIEHFDGRRFTLEPTPKFASGKHYSLSAIACASRTRCTTVGSSSPTHGASDSNALAEHWDGRRWSLDTTPHIAESGLYSVSCPRAAARCTAVGAAYPAGTVAEATP